MLCSDATSVSLFVAISNISSYLGNFPASGMRWREDGTFLNLGTEGSSWSSSSAGSGIVNPSRLNTNNTNVNPLFSTYRDYGFPVRCVQELTGSLLSKKLRTYIIIFLSLFVMSLECCNAY